MKNNQKDKRVPVNQLLQQLHEHYDGLERCSLAALEKALHEVLGIGPKRFERVKEVYLDYLGEEGQRRSEEFKKQAKRRIG